MDATTLYHSSSSSSSNISSPSNEKPKRSKRKQASFHASLNSFNHKPKIMKMPIAPFPRIPPKIHFVEPKDFKDVVHRLTTSLEYQLGNPLEVAPSPPNDISLQMPHNQATLIVLDNDDDVETPSPTSVSFEDDLMNLEIMEHEITEGFADSFGPLSPLSFQVSPFNSQTWLPSLLWSPGTMYSVEQEMLF